MADGRHMAQGRSTMHRRLVDTLYTEAMLIADEARDYFDDHGCAERDALDPIARVTFSCEALKVTTRLMHVIAWLLTQRAVDAGELTVAQALHPSRRLSQPPASDEMAVALLPAPARRLTAASAALHRRAASHDAALAAGAPPASPARLMQALLVATL